MFSVTPLPLAGSLCRGGVIFKYCGLIIRATGKSFNASQCHSTSSYSEQMFCPCWLCKVVRLCFQSTCILGSPEVSQVKFAIVTLWPR